MGSTAAKIDMNSEVQLSVSTAFDFLSAEYEALFAQSDATIFQSPFWLDAFYRNLVPSLGAEPVIVTLRDRDTQELLLVLPFVRQRSLGTKIMQPADLGISDYNAAIARRDTLEQLANDDAFKRELKGVMEPFDILLFRKQRPDTFDAGRLWHDVKSSPNDNSSYEFDIKGDYDKWHLEKLSKSLRKNTARKRRGFLRDIGALNFRIVKDEETIRRALTYMRDQRTKLHPDNLLQMDAYFDFYMDVAINHAADEKAITYIGEMDGNIMTVDFGLCDNGRYHFLLGAYEIDEAYKKYSIGMQALLEMIKVFGETGNDIFDFTIGDEPYKLELGASPVALTNHAVTNSVMGKMALAAYQHGSHVKDIVKKLSPNVH